MSVLDRISDARVGGGKMLAGHHVRVLEILEKAPTTA